VAFENTLINNERGVLPAESLLTLTITDARQRKTYQTPQTDSVSNYYVASPLNFIGGAIFWAALRQDAARFLVAGGISESHVPAALLLLAGSIALAIAGIASLRSEIRLVNSRQRFVTSLSGEFRKPLDQILLFAQLLRGRTRTEPVRDRSLEIMERETNRLIALSDPESAGSNPALQLGSFSVDVADIVYTSVDWFAPFAESRKTRIVLDVEGPAIALGDPAAIQQILINVLESATKSGPAGQMVSIGVCNEGKDVRLRVDARELAFARENIRQPSFRLGSTLDGKEGVGLRLSIVHDIATAMDAEVDLSEGLASGMRFTLVLPGGHSNTPS
jgi:two-component system phosphate regulon sensor histidine kinase PhoR